MEEDRNVRITGAYRDKAGEWHDRAVQYVSPREARLMGMFLTAIGGALQEGRTTHEEVEEFALTLLGIDSETWDRHCEQASSGGQTH